MEIERKFLIDKIPECRPLNTHILNSSAYTDTNYVFITEVFMLIKKERFHFAQEEEGQLMVDVTDRVNNRPIDGASVSISYPSLGFSTIYL